MGAIWWEFDCSSDNFVMYRKHITIKFPLNYTNFNINFTSIKCSYMTKSKITTEKVTCRKNINSKS